MRFNSFRFVRMFCEHFILIPAICALHLIFVCDWCRAIPEKKYDCSDHQWFFTPNQNFYTYLNMVYLNTAIKNILPIPEHAEPLGDTTLPIMIISTMLQKLNCVCLGYHWMFNRVVIDSNPSTEKHISTTVEKAKRLEDIKCVSIFVINKICIFILWQVATVVHNVCWPCKRERMWRAANLWAVVIYGPQVYETRAKHSKRLSGVDFMWLFECACGH